MANKDILIVQEQASGAPKQIIVTPTAGQFLKTDGSNNPAAALPTTADISDSTTAGRALLTAADAAAQRTLLSAALAREIKTASFTAVVGGRYVSSHASVKIVVTDPSGTAGQSYTVIVGLGTMDFGSGTVYAASRIEVVRYHNGSAWTTLAPVLSDSLTLNGTANTAPNQTAATGTSLMTRDLNDIRFGRANNIRYEALSAVGVELITAVATIANKGTSGTGICFFSTLKTTNISGSIKTSTGYARPILADGTLGTQFGDGVAGNNQSINFATGGTLSQQRAFGIMSVANAGSTMSGTITYLDLYNNQLTSFTGAGLSALTGLYLYSNQLTSFSGTGMSAVTGLNLSSNQLTSFNGSGLSAVTSLYLNYNQLTSFSGTGLSALTTLWIYSNQLTSFNATGLSALTRLELYTNPLISFSGANLTSLSKLLMASCNLTTVLLPPMNTGVYQQIDITGSSLNAAALNACYTALGASPSGKHNSITVTGNPGTSSDTPTIATSKGWTVVGS